MSRPKRNDEPQACPVGRFLQELEKALGPQSEVRRHFARSQLEMLKALRAFVDSRIEHLEKQGSARQRKKSTRIDVE